MTRSPRLYVEGAGAAAPAALLAGKLSLYRMAAQVVGDAIRVQRHVDPDARVRRPWRGLAAVKRQVIYHA